MCKRTCPPKKQDVTRRNDSMTPNRARRSRLPRPRCRLRHALDRVQRELNRTRTHRRTPPHEVKETVNTRRLDVRSRTPGLQVAKKCSPMDSSTLPLTTPLSPSQDEPRFAKMQLHVVPCPMRTICKHRPAERQILQVTGDPRGQTKVAGRKP